MPSPKTQGDPQNKPNIFSAIFGEMDKFLQESVRQDELIRALEAVTDIIRRVDARLTQSVNEAKSKEQKDIQALQADLKASDARVRELIASEGSASKASLQAEVATLRRLLDEVREEMPEIPDHTERFLALERGLSETQHLNGEDIRNYLEALNGEDRLAMSAIGGLLEALEELRNRPMGRTGGTPQGLRFLIDGVKKGIISNMNFKAGTGMSIAYSKVNGQDTITFNASSSGLTVETPPETPNASTTVFTVTAEPQWVVADGITLYPGAGYSYSSLQVTLDVAPSASIRAII